MFKVLVADDEMKIRETISDYFTAKGISVVTAENGKTALDKFYENYFDMVILDIMMPVMDGYEACRQLRGESDVPVLFLTAKGQEQDYLKGYNIGCDDYIVKPFPLSVLYEKAVYMMRKYRGLDKNNRLSVSGITLDTDSMKVFTDDKEIALSNKDFKILKYLMENKNIVISRELIITHIWGYDFDGDDRVVDTHIKRIRQALGEKSFCIKTVINNGYSFQEVEI